MNAKAEPQASKLDTVKLTSAVILLLGGVAAFYYFSEQALVVRVIGMLVVAGLAALIALQTTQGAEVWSVLKATRTEVRKVVWPTRAETIQATLAVVVMVIVVGIALWLLDMLLVWLVQMITGQGG